MKFCIDTKTTEYESVDECVNDLREVLPDLRVTRFLMENSGDRYRNPTMYRHVTEMIQVLEDAAKFREMLQRYAEPDGRIICHWADDAWQMFQIPKKGSR